MTARLARALRVRAGEGPVVLPLLALMLVAWAGFAIGANGVESIFFTRFGPQFLPWMYIALALVTVPATLGVGAVLGRGDRRRVVAAFAPAMAVAVFALRGLAVASSAWVYPTLWLGMMVLWIVQGIAVWSVAGVVHDARQAKRLFPLYGAGVILGGALGGLATPPLAATIGAENLLLVWGASLVAAWPLCRVVLAAPARHRHPALRGHRPRPPRVLEEMREGFRTARSSPLLRRMSLAAVLVGFLYFTLTLPFAEAVTARYPDTDRLASFLGLFSGTANALALVVSLAAANRLFARFGVPAMVIVMPVVYLLGFGVVAVSASFATLIAFRLVQLVWVHGVYTTGWQALFGIVPPERRAQARTFVEGGPMQLGILISGAVLLLAQRLIADRTLFVVAAAVAAAAVLVCWWLRRAYGDAVVDALRAGWPEVFKPGDSFAGVRWDAAAFDALRAGATDPEPSVRRVAMEIAADVPLVRARPLCMAGLRDPDAAVRIAALRGVARASVRSAVGDVVVLLNDPDASVRVAAIDALVVCAAGKDAARHLEPLLADADVRVRASAATHLARTHVQARRDLEALAGHADAEHRALAIDSLSKAGVAPERVVAALDDPEPRVRVAAVRGASHIGGSTSRLVAALGDEHDSVRVVATDALVAVGDGAVAELLVALDDPARDEGAIEALARLRAVDAARLRAYARRHVDRALHYHGLWAALAGDGDAPSRLIEAALRDRAVAHARRAVQATSPFGDREAIALAVDGLVSRDASQRANAVETLEATGDRVLVRPLLEVWDPSGPRGDRLDALRRAMTDDDPWVRACAVVAAAAEGGALGDAVAAATSDPDALVRETAARAAEGRGRDVETLSTLSIMQRVLALREVPLFRELRSVDLKRVADAATEHVYPDGTVIAERGDPGDAMHVVVAGKVRVLVDEDGRLVEVASRGPGYIVGEMAVLTDEPRMASLVAAGDVRTLSLDRARFQRILRERPDAAAAVMRELCARLRDVHEHREFEVPR